MQRRHGAVSAMIRLHKYPDQRIQIVTLTWFLARGDEGQRYDPLSWTVPRAGDFVGEWAWAFTQAMKLATILRTDCGTFYLQTASAVTVAIVSE